MRYLRLRSGPFIAAVLACMLALGVSGFASAQTAPELARRGEAIVARDCAMCHAVGREEPIVQRRTPALRSLSRRVAPDALRQQLTTGITAGHPEMPRLRYEAGEIDAIMAYLRSIQDE